MTGSHERIIALSLALLTVFGVVAALPALALEPDSGSTYVNPSAPGATGEFRATVVAERGDNITQNGLKTVTLDFSADPDYSGSIAGVTPRDVEVRATAASGNGTVPAGPVRVSSNPAGDRLTITLPSAYQNVQPGDEISVTIDGVRNPEIAIPDPQGVRGFTLRVAASDPQGNTDGPVELLYSIDPNATAPNATNTTGPNASNVTGAGNATAPTMTDSNTTGSNASNMTGANASNTTAPNMTSPNMSGSNMTGSNTTDSNTTGPNASNMTGAGNVTADATSTADSTTTTTTVETSTTTTTTTTAAATATPAETTGGGGATETTTTGPGFGLVAAVIALLAVALLATRRRG
jgi:PGF-CTERM protein